jgi:hypothetical protein
MDGTAAEHNVVVAAIRYTETASNTVIKDLNNVCLKQLEEYNRCQLKRLEEENRSLRLQLRRANLKSNKIARGWFLSVSYMLSFSRQFCNLVILSTYGGVEAINDSMNRALANIVWDRKIAQVYRH